MTDELTEALRDAEQRYRILFEQAPVGVFLYDRELVIREFNARFVQILRSTAESLRGLDLRTLKDQRLGPTLERALAGEPALYEGPYRATTSSAVIQIGLRVSPLRDPGGGVAGGMGVVEDLTERARATAALVTSERRLALHVRRSPLGVVAFDPQERVVEWNAAAERIFGWTEHEALGRNAVDLLVPPWARDKVHDIFRALLSRCGGERSVNENLTRDGRVILCDWYNTMLADDAGEVIGVASIIDDITESQQAGIALKRSEARFRTLIEHAPDAIAVYPPDDQRLVYANGTFASLLGYDAPQEILGRPFDDFVHGDDRAALGRRSATIADAHGPLPPQEVRMVRRDGGTLHAELVSMIIEYDDRPHVMVFGRDVSERKEMQARLLLADRMASVGTLAAGVAHELNNPLAYTMTSLEALASRRLPPILERLRALGGEPAQVSADLAGAIGLLDVAREGCGRVRDIVRDLKAFARSPDEERPTPVDVRRILDASINVAWNEIRHRARLVKSYDDVPPVLATEARLGQVFLNLLVNAAQALPVGGVGEHEIRVRATSDADQVVVAISDTGPGIPKEHLARIFDPFFTTKPVGVGTGLGLWICQGIVTSLGGRISAESDPEGGATFRVALPAARDAVEQAPPSSVRAGAAPGAPRLRLLVVDDEVALGRTLAVALADEFDITLAASGREAIATLGEKPFDVILCDLMMPDVSGMDVYERMERQAPELTRRFVFVTGGAFTERARAFVERVAAPVVEKPFELSTLPVLLRERARRATR